MRQFGFWPNCVTHVELVPLPDFITRWRPIQRLLTPGLSRRPAGLGRVPNFKARLNNLQV